MPPPKKPTLKDIDSDEKVSLSDAANGTSSAIVPVLSGLDFVKSDGVPIPTAKDLETPEASIAWADNELAKATPRAVQELVHQLRVGDKKERREVAMKLVDRAERKAAAPQGMAPVYVMAQNVTMNLPWVKKTETKDSAEPKVIEGTIVPERL